MISAWHLLWIIPVSASFGLVTACLCFAASSADKHIKEDSSEEV